MWCTYNNQILNFQWNKNNIRPLQDVTGRIINFQDMEPGKLYDNNKIDRFTVFAATEDSDSRITKWYVFKE